MKHPNPQDNDPIGVQFASLQARCDLLEVVLKTIIRSGTYREGEHLAALIDRALTQYQDASLFSVAASESYRVAFSAVAESFSPAKLFPSRAGQASPPSSTSR
jgi:hypothetical protein